MQVNVRAGGLIKGHAEIKVFLSSLFNPNSPASDHSSSLKNLVPPTSRLSPVNSLHSNLAITLL